MPCPICISIGAATEKKPVSSMRSNSCSVSVHGVDVRRVVTETAMPAGRQRIGELLHPPWPVGPDAHVHADPRLHVGVSSGVSTRDGGGHARELRAGGREGQRVGSGSSVEKYWSRSGRCRSIRVRRRIRWKQFGPYL